MATTKPQKSLEQRTDSVKRPKRVAEITPQQQKRIDAISAKIVALRKKTDLNTEEFAIAHSIHRATYANAEKSSNITIATLLRILQAHNNLSLEDFFKGIK
jgi:DNA-binding transcriptional regulator YiaG